MQWVILLKTVIEMIPAILRAVRSIEEELPESGAGSDKLALLKEAIGGALDAADDFMLDFNRVWPALEKLINAAVSFFNKRGVFPQ